MALKIRTQVKFPTSVQGGEGISVTKTNGVWDIALDFDSLNEIDLGAFVNPDQKHIIIYDPDSEDFAQIALGALGDGLFKATSTTSVEIGLGEKTLQTQSGKAFYAGGFVHIISDADTANYFAGQVVSYIDDELIVTSTLIHGSGTHADWTIINSGAHGIDFAVLDEDDFASDSDTAVPTQQSTKAYFDTNTAGMVRADAVQAFDAAETLQARTNISLSKIV